MISGFLPECSTWFVFVYVFFSFFFFGFLWEIFFFFLIGYVCYSLFSVITFLKKKKNRHNYKSWTPVLWHHLYFKLKIMKKLKFLLICYNFSSKQVKRADYYTVFEGYFKKIEPLLFVILLVHGSRIND